VDNLSEPFYRGLIRCLLSRGESAEALKTFLLCRRLLSIVLNLQPGAETLALVRGIYDSAHLEAPLPGKPSIVVLPFANLSAMAEQEYFVDGLVEDLITALSRFHSLLVIARNSSFAYKGKAAPVRTVARELGVRYVLEGSIRLAMERVRISVHLVDSTTGSQLWAQSYDRALDDIFVVQEELTQSIVMAIAPQIDSAERAKAYRRRPENLSAYEFAIRARANSLDAYLRSDAGLRDRAIGEARSALAIEPDSSIALNALARLHWQQVLFGSAADRDLAWREGIAAAAKAVDVDRQDEQGYANLGLLLTYAPSRDRMDEALDNLRHAIALNPNSANTLNALAFVEVASGDPENATGYVDLALRLSPHDPLRYSLYLVLAMASCSLGRFEHGVACALLGLKEAPGQAMLHVYLAANYVGLKRLPEAKGALRAAELAGPAFVQRATDGELIYRDPVVLRRVTTFLRIAAGLEDPAAAATLR
jgi:adenylate cyclase